MLQNDAWLQPALKKPPHVDELFIVCALPLYHIFALTACFLLGVRAGGVNLLIPNPRDMPGFVKELMKYQVNSFPAVNTLYNGLLNTPGFDKVDFSKLKTSIGGGMATQKAVAEKWLKITGCALSEGYGLSETSPTLTCNPADTDKFSGSIGIPVPSTYLSIRDDDGNEVPLGTAGEICAKGPQVMAGYWNRPEETAKVMTADGFFRTGDIGVMTTGRLHQDRRSQEGHDPGLRLQRLSQRDRGSDREPSRRAGMRRDRRRRTPSRAKPSRRSWSRRIPTSPPRTSSSSATTQLTNYKMPKQIEFRTDLPKTNVGKILRRELRDEKKAAAA